MKQGESLISLKKQGASSKTFLLSNNGTFLYSFCNGAFGSKWCGLWHNDIKFLDYFAFRVGGKWLSPKNFSEIRYDGVTAELIYNVGQKVSQKISVSDGNLAIQLSAENSSEFDLELGVNIRYRDENIHHREYASRKHDALFVKNSLGGLKIYAKDAHYTPVNITEEHFPGGYAREKGFEWSEDIQEKFVPSIVSTKGKRAEFIISIQPHSGNSFADTKKTARSYIRKKAKLLDWKDAVSVSQFVTTIQGKKAFMAGFPYFNEFWTRDFLWMAEPLRYAGFSDEVKEALELIGENQAKEGGIPSIVGRNASPVCADSTPLWIIAVDNHAQETGKILMEKEIKKALKFGESCTKDCLVNHHPKLTWMDTLHRENAIEVQALWVDAFERAGELFEQPKYDDTASCLWESIEEKFLENGVFIDSLKGPYKFTANCLVPVIMGHASLGQKKRTLKKTEKELVTKFGLKAVSKHESSHPEKYHERVWGLTTYWGLLASDNFDMLKGFSSLRDALTLYGMSETISGGTPMGATHQLWSTAFLPSI